MSALVDIIVGKIMKREKYDGEKKEKYVKENDNQPSVKRGFDERNAIEGIITTKVNRPKQQFQVICVIVSQIENLCYCFSYFYIAEIKFCFSSTFWCENKNRILFFFKAF